MIRRYYVAPWVTLYAVGGGQFSLTNPGGARQISGSRVLIHGVWQRDVTGHYCETVKPTSARGRGKGTCVTYAEAPDVDALNLHASIAADTEIASMPWTPDNLNATFGTLTAQEQRAVRAYMATIFCDDLWIIASTPFFQIMSYFLHVMFAAQQLGTSYPGGPLTSRWNGLAAQQQTDINSFLTSFGRAAISGNPTIRVVVNECARVDYGAAGNPRMGGVNFAVWTP